MAAHRSTLSCCRGLFFSNVRILHVPWHKYETFVSKEVKYGNANAMKRNYLK